MLDFTQILSEFHNLVGYKNENEIILTPDLNQSDSGLFVNDIAGVDLLSIQKSAFLKSDLTPEKTVSDYLSDIYNTEVIALLLQFIREKENYLKNSLFPAREKIVEKSASQDKLAQSERFVGFYIYLSKSHNLLTKILRLSLQLTESQTIRVYLYDLNKKQPIKTQDIDITHPFDRIYHDLTDFILNYNGSGEYLIGYYEYQSDNPQAYQLHQNNNSYKIDKVSAKSIKKLVNIAPISIDKSYLDTTNFTLPDTAGISPILYSAGLDLEIEIDCDYTDLIINNKMKFAEALQIQLAKRIIGDCLYTKEFNTVTESNRSRWQSMILYFNNRLNGYEFQDEHGNSGRKEGLIKELIKSFEGIDNVCFPKLRTIKL